MCALLVVQPRDKRGGGRKISAELAWAMWLVPSAMFYTHKVEVNVSVSQVVRT